jgi:hypothetical protein
MKEQGERLEWKERRKLLKQIVHIEDRYGNYSILRLSDGHYAVLDWLNFKFLLSSSGRLYALPDNWKKWFKKGFIVVTFSKSLRNSKYYIFNVRDKRFIAEGSEVKVYADAFLEEQSDYFIAGNDHLGYAVFNKDGNQISDWFDEIEIDGLLRYQPGYYKAKKDRKYALFHRDGYQVSDWYDWIRAEGLIENQSDYYLAEQNYKYAIFHKDGRQVSDWFDYINSEGLVFGGSDYYVATKDGKEAIFYKDGQQISDWFDDISISGLIRGRSDYYVVKKDGKYAIFHKNGDQISDWFDWLLDTYGLICNESDYYIAMKNNKYAIFYRDGRQITDWFDQINPEGLVEGSTDYYVAYNFDKTPQDYKQITYIGKLGSLKLLGPLKAILNAGFIYHSLGNTITLKTLDGQTKIFTKQELNNFFEEREVNYEQTK